MLETSFSILFFIRKPKGYVSGATPVYMRLTVNGNRKEIGTKQECEPSSGDKNAVASMVHFPFEDGRDLGQGMGKGPQNLTCRDKSMFVQKYDQIFTVEVKAAIAANKYDRCVEYDGDPGNEHQPIKPNCYQMIVAGSNLSFSLTKVRGEYVLSGIPYSE